MKTIRYAGKECRLFHSTTDSDEAQNLLDTFRRENIAACCLHEGDVCIVYVERKKQ